MTTENKLKKTTKKTTTKKATDEIKLLEEEKKIEENSSSSNNNKEIAEAIVDGLAKVLTQNIQTETKQKKEYSDKDLILCESITRGYLSCKGKKTGEIYRFTNHGDTCEIEAQDLNGLKASKSAYLYKPLFIIKDEEFLEQPKWKDIKELYQKTVVNDINDLIDLPNSQFEAALSNLPEGYRDILRDEVATRIHNGTFDSLTKIKIIDKICGTDLKLLIE